MTVDHHLVGIMSLSHCRVQLPLIGTNDGVFDSVLLFSVATLLCFEAQSG